MFTKFVRAIFIATFLIAGWIGLVIFGSVYSVNILNHSDRELGAATVLMAPQGGTGNSSYSVGNLLYASAASQLSKLAIGSTDQHLIVSGGLPVWSSNATNTNFGFTFASGSTLYAATINVNGSAVCLANGTNCPASGGTQTLAQTTALGAITSDKLSLFGGYLAASSTVTSTLQVIGLSTLTAGYVAQSSSTVVGAFTVTGLETQNSGYVSGASSTIVGGLTITGNSTTTNATTTNLYANLANLITSSSTFDLSVNSTTTNFGFTFASGTTIRAANISVNGSAVCLANGTNCPAGGSQTLAQTTALGAITSDKVSLFGGYLAASSTVTSTLTTVGLSTFVAGYVSQSSSTVVGNLTDAGLFTVSGGYVSQASSTVVGNFTDTGLSTLAGGFVSQASSTIVGAFTDTGATVLGSTLNVSGLSTLTSGYVSQSSSTVVGALTATGLFSGNSGFVSGASSTVVGGLTITGNSTTTNATTTNLYVSGAASTTVLYVNGQLPCLANGTNCPSGISTPSLAQVTTVGATSSEALTLYGGFTAAASVVTSTLEVDGTINAYGSPALNISNTGGNQSGMKITSTDSSLYGTIDWVNDAGAQAQMLMAGSAFTFGVFQPNSATFYNYSGNSMNLGTVAGAVNLFAGGYDLTDIRLSVDASNITAKASIIGGTNNTYNLGAFDSAFANIYASGTANLGAVTFSNATGTSLAATTVTTTNAYVNGRILATKGSASAPSYGFSDAAQTGMYGTGGTQINFGVSNGLRVGISGTALFPGTNNSVTLGTSSLFWSTLFSTNVTSTNSSSTDGYLQKAKIGVSILPWVNNVPDIGSGTLSFKDVYASGTIRSVAVSSTGAAIDFPGIGAPAVTADLVCWTATTGRLTHQATNCTVSSVRFKEHIKSLDSKVLMEYTRKLRAVSFDFTNGGLGTLGDAHDEGFIAEEVAMIDPYLVAWERVTSDDEGLQKVRNLYPSVPRLMNGTDWIIPKTVDYAKVSMLLTGAIHDLDERVLNLEKTDNVNRKETLGGFGMRLRNLLLFLMNTFRIH